MHIVYGLGNSGSSYRGHRHNVGMQLVHDLASDLNVSMDEQVDGARFGRGQMEDASVVFAAPSTYINQSGIGFQSLRSTFSASAEQVLIVYDDLDLDAGSLRLRPSGGAGGHNGVQSILDNMEGDQIPRLRLGIGRPPDDMKAAEYVLQPFSSEEKEIMQETLDRGKQAVNTWIQNGLQQAMNQFN